MRRSSGFSLPDIDYEMPDPFRNLRIPPEGSPVVCRDDGNPIEEGTTVAIWPLPRDCTPTIVLGYIRDVGKIWDCILGEAGGRPIAWVQFWTALAYRRFLDQYEHAMPRVLGVQTRVYISEKENAPRPRVVRSRAMVLSGPTRVVNVVDLVRFFRDRCNVKLDDIKERKAELDESIIEVRFASYSREALPALRMVEEAKKCDRLEDQLLEEDRAWQLVDIGWGVDPCDEDYDAKVAAQDVRGDMEGLDS
ncbi:hypothetical protein F5Y15DRAFT_312082 [Xylariaceae sp. FL0016]|nr:hypothetical protein F5Y15DRAFT_312082 [Xylariaceae sp. FL0016]